MVAVGDVACAPGQARRTHRCRQADTAALARSMHPDAVLALGDLQYESGGLRAFRRSYDATWGRLKAVTFPVPGNHEYRTPAASGYYTYFDGRQPGAPGWYVRRLGAWRVYFLNSNCDHVDCATEARWLRGALDRHPARCSAVVTHHPRYSSGEHGPDPAVRPFFRIAVRHRVELVLSGHDHDYERFARMGAHGRPTRAGTIQIVSGLGGRSTYPVGEPARGSRARVTGRFGVLRLSLHRGGFRFAFTAVGGRVLDRGHRSCR